jgi:phenylacetate-CoA ligase
MMIIRGVNVFPSQIEELVLARAELSSHHLIKIDRLDHLDVVRVKVEPRAARGEANWPRLERDLETAIKSQVGISTKVTVVPVGSLARSEGKVQRVIDSRPRN